MDSGDGVRCGFAGGDDLVLSFKRSGQRGVIDVVMTLTLDGEMLDVTQSVAGGQFSQTGTGKNQ